MLQNLPIQMKIGLVMIFMAVASLAIAGVGILGMRDIGGTLASVGTREEMAREAMDLPRRHYRHQPHDLSIGARAREGDRLRH